MPGELLRERAILSIIASPQALARTQAGCAPAALRPIERRLIELALARTQAWEEGGSQRIVGFVGRGAGKGGR